MTKSSALTLARSDARKLRVWMYSELMWPKDCDSGQVRPSASLLISFPSVILPLPLGSKCPPIVSPSDWELGKLQIQIREAELPRIMGCTVSTRKASIQRQEPCFKASLSAMRLWGRGSGLGAPSSSVLASCLQIVDMGWERSACHRAPGCL